MFEKFQDYMYYLLYSPLKKVAKAKNQFYILFKVFGKVFDQSKQDIFRVREESMVISASSRMLDEHGRDRKMPRYKNEDIESYRTRLLMKNIIAERAGTNRGILMALWSIGYPNAHIEPAYKLENPNQGSRFLDGKWKLDGVYTMDSLQALRWAEFIVFLDNDIDAVLDFDIAKRVVRDTKPASALPLYGWRNSVKEIVNMNSRVTNRLDVLNHISVENVITLSIFNQTNENSEIRLTTEINAWYLNGNELLNGEKLLNAEIITEVL